MEISVEDKPRSRPKKFEDKELETLLEKDQESKRSLQNHCRGNSTSHFCTIESLQKQGNCLMKLKPRDVEKRFFACEQLIQRQ